MFCPIGHFASLRSAAHICPIMFLQETVLFLGKRQSLMREKLRDFRSFSPQKLTTRWIAGHLGLRHGLLVAPEGDWGTLGDKSEDGSGFFSFSGVFVKIDFRSRWGGPDLKPAGFQHCGMFIQVPVR